MDTNPNSNSKIIFYSLVGFCASAMIGATYYMYKTFISERNETDNNSIISSNNKNNKPIIRPKNNTCLTKERAIEIYVEIFKKLEEYMQVLDSEAAKKERRTALRKGEDSWIPVVSLFLSKKNQLFLETRDLILKENKVSLTEFERIMPSITLKEMDKALNSSWKPKFTSEVPSKEKVKEAYIWHCETLYNDLNSKFNSQSNINPQERTYYMLLERVRIDDELFFKYGINLPQLKYLLYINNLYEDPEVFKWSSIFPE
jgi:hypothetical protein